MTERDPLWEPAVEDDEVRGLADALAPLRHRAPLRPLPAHRPSRPRWPLYLGAVVAAAALTLAVWRPWRPGAKPPAVAIGCEVAAHGFRYEATAGAPTCGGASSSGGWLPVGGAIETGDGDRVRVEVADIGEIELGERSRLGLVATGPDEHRLALDRGSLHAKVVAPPRLFVIDTPTATAVDLGCEYDLAVDADGSSTLRVTSGVVELAAGSKLSVVPMGAGAITRRGTGPGTPWALGAGPPLRAAIDQLDAGDARALDDVIRLAGAGDTVTLWNLLGRVGPDERGRVYDAIDAVFSVPEWVLRDDVVAGRGEAITHLREALEGEWMFASDGDGEDEPEVPEEVEELEAPAPPAPIDEPAPHRPKPRQAPPPRDAGGVWAPPG